MDQAFVRSRAFSIPEMRDVQQVIAEAEGAFAGLTAAAGSRERPPRGC
jgi:hypothetical protein